MTVNKKLKKNNLADQVCDAIRKSVRDKEWVQGAKLPSEASLAEMYGVNRLTIRIALQKLNAMGILETRAGEGTFVSEFDFIKYINGVSDLIMSPDILEDVWEFRKYFELECIRLSIQNAGEDEIKNLEGKYNAFEKIAKGKQVAHNDGIHQIIEADLEFHSDRIHQIIEADLEFHYEICKSTKNLLFPLAFAAVREPLYHYIKSVISFRVRQRKANPGKNPTVFVSNESLGHHRTILDGIRSRDYKICEKVYIEMTDHKRR